MKKTFYLFSLFSLFSLFACSQINKEASIGEIKKDTIDLSCINTKNLLEINTNNDFENVIYEVLKGFNDGNIKLINKHIHPDYGILHIPPSISAAPIYYQKKYMDKKDFEVIEEYNGIPNYNLLIPIGNFILCYDDYLENNIEDIYNDSLIYFHHKKNDEEDMAEQLIKMKDNITNYIDYNDFDVDIGRYSKEDANTKFLMDSVSRRKVTLGDYDETLTYSFSFAKLDNKWYFTILKEPSSH